MLPLFLLKFLAFVGLVGIVFFYPVSVYTDSAEDGRTNQFSRWLYLACWVIFISSVLLHVLGIFLPNAYSNPIVILSIIGISCLFFQDRFKIIGTNEVWIGQNTWITRTVNDRSMRLQFRGGINILLHGEVLIKKITDEVYVYDLEVKNIECLEGVPMIAKLAYQIAPDFSDFQALTRLDENENERIKKARKVFDAAIINLISIVFAGEDQETIKSDRKSINEKVREHVFDQSFLAPQEINTGYKVLTLQISDTDDTDEIRKANEQYYVSKGQGKAVQALLGALEINTKKLEKIDPREKKRLMEGLLASVQANSGKIQKRDVNVRIDGGEVDKESKSRIKAEILGEESRSETKGKK